MTRRKFWRTRLGPYDIVSFIGAGTMGVVYKARDARLGRHVASRSCRRPSRAIRIAWHGSSARHAVAAINHPNIVSVHDIGSADVLDDEKWAMHAAYLVTALLDGDTLRDRLAAGSLTAPKSADVAMRVARGLAAAHDRGIVHRDLKPENLVLLRDGPDRQKASSIQTSHEARACQAKVSTAARRAQVAVPPVGAAAPTQTRP